MELLMPLSIYALIIFLIIRKFKKYKQNGMELLDAYRDMPHTLHQIELDVRIVDSDLFNSTRILPTYKTNVFLFDKFLYINQCNSMILTRNNTRLVFPLVLSADTRVLKAKFPNCLIAKVTQCYFRAWNSLEIKAELVWNGTIDLELNILFLENKNDNSRRLMQILNPAG